MTKSKAKPMGYPGYPAFSWPKNQRSSGLTQLDPCPTLEAIYSKVTQLERNNTNQTSYKTKATTVGGTLCRRILNEKSFLDILSKYRSEINPSSSSRL